MGALDKALTKLMNLGGKVTVEQRGGKHGPGPRRKARGQAKAPKPPESSGR